MKPYRNIIITLVVLIGAAVLGAGMWWGEPPSKRPPPKDLTPEQELAKEKMNEGWLTCFRSQGIDLGDNTRIPELRSIDPDVLPDQEDAPYLSVILSSPDYKFKTGEGPEEKTKALKACYSWGIDHVEPINIQSIEHSPSGRKATIKLDLPDKDFFWLERCPRCNVALVVASKDEALDEQYIARGSFHFISRGWAFVAASLLTLGGVYGFKQLRGFHSKKDNAQNEENADKAQQNPGKSGASGAWWMGLVIGQDGQPSLSLFQILIWTVLTVWALLYVFFNTGNLLTMTNQVMILLGFAGVGSLTARWIAAGRQHAKPSPTNQADTPRFWAMLEADGRLDLFKVQLLLFTVLIAGYVAFRIIRQSAFPELDPQFLLLMGVSNGLYVGTKFTQASPLAVAGARKIELDALQLREKDLEARQAELDAELAEINQKLAADPAIAQAVAEPLQKRQGKIQKELEKLKADLDNVQEDIASKTEAYRDALAAATQA